MAVQGRIIKTGSSGNCIFLHNSIVIDIGVPYSLIKPIVKDIQIVCCTHLHFDHINFGTLKKLQFERPSVRIAAGKWFSEPLKEFKNVDILELNKWYDYGKFKLSIGKLYHDIENGFWRIEKNGYKQFYATDTAHLNGISAKNYNEYWIEANYDEDMIHEIIERKQANGEFAHQIGAINSHLSIQQAQNFILNNAGENYEFLPLHKSNEF
jgi:hypothetical protein